MSEHKKTDQNKLKDAGYSESSKKPNLFYKPLSVGAVFADMRDSGIIWIWIQSKNPVWWNVRIANRELKNLQFKHFSSVLEIHYRQPYDNGYCRTCGKDFQDDGLYCSDECERIAFYKKFIKTYNPDKKNWVICEVCGKYVECGSATKHHISYYPELTIPVHHKCHQKIHHTDLYTHLKPPVGDSKDFYNSVKNPANWIESGIPGTELKVTYSALASCYPKPNLNWNRAAKTEIDKEYSIMYRKKSPNPGLNSKVCT